MLSKHGRRTYLRLSNEDYLRNIMKSWGSLTFNRGKLKGLPEANHGSYAQVALYGLPFMP